MKPASGQKSASVWIFSSEMATASCRPERPVSSSRRRVISSVPSSRM